jgi:hypothetical protein
VADDSYPSSSDDSLAALLAIAQEEDSSDNDDDDDVDEDELDEEDDEDDDDSDDSESEANEQALLLRDYEHDKMQTEAAPLSTASLSKERTLDDLYHTHTSPHSQSLPTIVWLAICFFGIMISFVGYGLLLEYSTSDGRQVHEMSFLFITSLLYTITAAAGRYVRDETPSTIPPARFAILGLTSMGSTWCSVRSLRFVIFPIQVLAKSCKVCVPTNMY